MPPPKASKGRSGGGLFSKLKFCCCQDDLANQTSGLKDSTLHMTSTLTTRQGKTAIGQKQIPILLPTPSEEDEKFSTPRNYPQHSDLSRLQREIERSTNQERVERNLLKGAISDDEDDEDGPPTIRLPLVEPQPSKPHSGNYQKFWSARESQLLRKLACKGPSQQQQSTKQSYTASLIANNYSNLIRTKTSEEDEADSELLSLYKKYGANWALIAQHVPSKSKK